MRVAPNANEVSDTRWVTQDELRQLMDDAKEGKSGVVLTPWFKLIAETLLPQWWNGLGSLEQFVSDEIVKF